MNHGAFVAATRTASWVDIDGLVAMLDAADYWDEDFLADAIDALKKAHARKQIKTIPGSDGLPAYQSVVTTDPMTGGTERRYKQEAMFDRDDYVQTIRYHRQRAEHHLREAAGLAQHGHDRYGLQLGLDLVISRDPA
jgi:hypothetical protein